MYGASHRFSVLREDIVEKPEPSPSNPRGLQERTVKEARLIPEFGPVTFPAYAGATAGRSQPHRRVPEALLRS
jgi:hypothetical protein